MYVQSLCHLQLFETPWTVAHQAPLSMGFPRKEYWIGLLPLLQEIFPTQGLYPTLAGGFSATGPHGKPFLYNISSVQSLSYVQLFMTPWIATHQASLSITNSRSSLKLTSIKSVMPSSHLILCRPLLLLPPIPPTSESFPMNQLFAWGGQSTGVSALASFLPKKSQGWSPLEWTGWISL